MIPRSQISQRRLQLAGIGALGILPALLLAAFGFYALHREQALALHDARETAQQQAARLANAIQSALLDLPLPSRADVEAFDRRPGTPDQEPLARLAAMLGDSHALFLLPEGTYPDLNPSPPTPPALDPDSLPAAFAEGWRSAASLTTDPAHSTTASQSWMALLELASGSDWEHPIRFRLAHSLLIEGRTDQARPLFEAIAHAPQPHPGETGLPLDVLALRSLLQLADADRRFAKDRPAWLDAFCERVLIRWRLPSTLLEEWESADASRIGRWKAAARRHREVRDTFIALDLPREPRTEIEAAPRWLGDEDANRSLLTTHEVAGGTWLVLRPIDQVRQAVRRALASELLPDYLGVSATIAGRSMVAVLDPAPRIPVLGSTTVMSRGTAFAAVALHLTRPDLLDARRRVRALVTATLIALATALAMVGFLLALRAYHHQRIFAEMQTDFVASVSHELRAPLAAVRLMSEELTDMPPEETARRSDYHRLILRETRRLGLLIENVLRHARLERAAPSLDRAPVDLIEVARAATESLQATAADQGLLIQPFLPSQPVIANVDPQALHQVLLNLLDNALKHSPTHGIVEIGLDAIPQSSAPAAPPAMARLWVADRGPGIPGSEHRRIFDSFYRRGTELRRETPGVGLGLAIVKRLVEAHGGTVTVASSPGAGTRFTIELPLHSPPTPSHESPPGRTQSPASPIRDGQESVRPGFMDREQFTLEQEALHEPASRNAPGRPLSPRFGTAKGTRPT